MILIRIPQDSVGLSSFANTSNLLGSPGSAQRVLDILTVSGIIMYFLGLSRQIRHGSVHELWITLNAMKSTNFFFAYDKMHSRDLRHRLLET